MLLCAAAGITRTHTHNPTQQAYSDMHDALRKAQALRTAHEYMGREFALGCFYRVAMFGRGIESRVGVWVCVWVWVCGGMIYGNAWPTECSPPSSGIPQAIDSSLTSTTPPPSKKQEYVYRLKSRRHLSEFQDRLLSTLARPYDDAAFGAAGGVDTRGGCGCVDGWMDGCAYG